MDTSKIAWVVQSVLGVAAIVLLFVGELYSVAWSPLAASTLGALVGLMIKRPSDALAPAKGPDARG